jgi:alkylation response protein AidB-like acyl-CoA dehydrogenase
MNFELSHDQTMLADSVDRFGRESWPLADRPRQLAEHGQGQTDRWRMMADLGWLALPFAESQGGVSGAPSDLMVVAEGLGRHLVPDPFVGCGVLIASLLGAERPELVESAIAGKTRVAVALGDGDARFDHLAIATTATPAGGGHALSGDKQFVLDGADADWFVVPARISDTAGFQLFLIPCDAPGLEVDRFRALDHHRHARLRLRDAVAATDAMIALDDTAQALDRAVQRATLALCAEAVGAMDALNDMTLEYLKTRKQFGAAIGNFQALQHRMVDMAIAAEEARSITYRATLEMEAGIDDGGRMVAAAKTRVGQTGLFVGRQAVQLHGGIGTSDELVISHYLKRLMMIDMTFGHADHHRARFAALAR